MNRRKYVSAILGMGSLIGLSRYSKKESRATLTGFRINNTDENNVVSLSTGSESINGLNLNFNNFNIETRNISQIDKDITVNIYARIENNDYSDIIESINISLSDSSEYLNNILDYVIIRNEDLIGNFPTVDEDMKELYIKIEINHDDFSNPEIFETNIILNVEKQDIIAEGGNEIYDIEINNIIYRVHAYTEVGTHTFDVSNADGEVDVLVIGGGGAGGLTYGSGGGAGGLVFEKNKNIAENKISVVVGDGGTSGKQSENSNNSYIPGEPGTDSIFGNITAIGGGGGATDGDYSNGNGGSGGGGGSNTALQPSSDSGGLGNEGDTDSRASGGGGAGESGIEAIGGDGVKDVIINDKVYNFADLFGLKYGEINNGEAWFAGGGVAQRYAPDGGIGGGGIGGGGSGEENPPDRPDLDRIGRKGMSNTGGGGGAGTTDSGEGGDGGKGGTGLVVIQYK